MHTLATWFATILTLFSNGALPASQSASAAAPGFAARVTGPITQIVATSTTIVQQPIIQTIDRKYSTPLPTDLVHQDDLANRLANIEAKLSAQIRALNPPTASIPQQVAAGGTSAGGNPYLSGLVLSISQAQSAAGGSSSGGSTLASSITGTITNAINSALGTIDSLITNNLFATNSTTTNATTTNLSVTGTAQLSSLAATGTTTIGTATGILQTNSGVVSSIVNGVNGQVLKIVAGVPMWGADLQGSGGGSSAWATTTDSLAIYTTDPTQVVLVGTSATSTTGNIFEVKGNALLRGSATTQGIHTASIFTATSTTATSSLPLAQITALKLGSDYLTSFSAPFYSYFRATTTDALAQGIANKYYSTQLFAADLAATTTDALAQGATNKYWSNTLFDTRLAATTSLPNITTLASLTLPAGQLTGFGVPFYQFFSATTTSALTEGANLYFTNSRVASVIAGTTTTALAEGSNLYFTNARADARINATSTIGTLTSAPSLGTLATSLTGFLKATAGVLSTALIDLASNITGILPVSNGGTGWASIASGAILFGNGSGAISTTTAGTTGQILALLGGVPTWASTTTFSSGLTYSAGNVTNTGVTSNVAGTGISVSAATGAVTINFAAPAGSALSIPYASTTAITATTASTTNLFLSGISSALLKTVNGQVSAAVAGTDYLASTFAYLFPSNATTTNIAFNGGFTTTNATATNAFAGTLTASAAAFGGTATSTFTSAGFLGIGTTSPTTRLDVEGVTTLRGSSDPLGAGALLEFRPHDADGYNQIHFYSEQGSNWDTGINTHKCAAGTGPNCTGNDLHRHMTFYTSPSIGGNPVARMDIEYGVADAKIDFSRSHLDFDTSAAPGAGGGYVSQLVMKNNGFVKSWNAAGSAIPNIIGLNGADQIEVGASGGTVPVIFYAGSEAMRLTATGKIGIGTTTPISKLTLTNSSADGITFVNTSQAGGSKIFSIMNLGTSLRLVPTDDAGSAIANGLNIDRSGTVGIGTTSPGTTLAVQGSGIFTNGLTNYGTHTATTVLATSTLAASTFPYASTTAITATNASTTNLWVSSLGIAAGTFLAVDGSGRVIATTTPAGGSGAAFPFTSTTNFGAVANSTSTPLLFTAGFQASSTVRFGNAGVAGQFLFDSTTGSLGLGTTSPWQMLSVAGTVATNAILPNGPYTTNLSAFDLGATGSRWNAVWAGALNIGTSTFSLKSDGASNLGLFTAASGGGTQAMTITSAGNVGIGSTTPNYTLDVNGDVNVATGRCFRVNGVCIGYTVKLAMIYATSSVASNVKVDFSAASGATVASTTYVTGLPKIVGLPANTSYIVSEVWGGGGAGGNNFGVGGGGAGGYSMKLYQAPLLSKYFYAVGAGATGSGGATGSNSTFGTGLATSTGNGGVGTLTAAGGAGGSASGGDLNLTGGAGSSENTGTWYGDGGSAPRGGSGRIASNNCPAADPFGGGACGSSGAGGPEASS